MFLVILVELISVNVYISSQTTFYQFRFPNKRFLYNTLQGFKENITAFLEKTLLLGS